MKPHHTPHLERRLILSLGFTGFIFLAELLGGFWTGSLALLSDAAHVFMDMFAIGLSYLALRLSALPADDRHTYGWHRLEVLAALLNGITLLVISVGIWYEAYQRWLEPPQVRSLEMFIIAVVGLVVNLIVALVLSGRHEHLAPKYDSQHQHIHNGTPHNHSRKDLNIHSAFLHVIGDAVSSMGVILAALIIWRTGWYWVDALASALIGVIILVSALRVTRAALHILVEGTPEGISPQALAKGMLSVDSVDDVHDLHVWSICSGHVALSAHVVLDEEGYQQQGEVMSQLKEHLRSGYGIEHTTIQFEEVPCEQGNGCGSS
ncbi:MAG: cation diffusion facilitator family transporter [Anaerolineales bacterium]